MIMWNCAAHYRSFLTVFRCSNKSVKAGGAKSREAMYVLVEFRIACLESEAVTASDILGVTFQSKLRGLEEKAAPVGRSKHWCQTTITTYQSNEVQISLSTHKDLQLWVRPAHFLQSVKTKREKTKHIFFCPPDCEVLCSLSFLMHWKIAGIFFVLKGNGWIILSRGIHRGDSDKKWVIPSPGCTCAVSFSSLSLGLFFLEGIKFQLTKES